MFEDEVRKCECQTDAYMQGLMREKLSEHHFVEAERPPRHPGCESTWFCRRAILGSYFVLLCMTATSLMITARSLASSRFEAIKSIFEGWTWSFALTTAVRVIVVGAIYPNTTIRDLWEELFKIQKLSQVRGSLGMLAILTRDARCNDIFKAGNHAHILTDQSGMSS